MQIVHLKKNRALLSPYVAMGTAEVKGEDNEAKGAVYLFEVAHLEVLGPLMMSVFCSSCYLQLQSAGGDVLFRLKQRCAKVLQGAWRAFCRLCIAFRYWSGNDHFFKHWKNPVSAITDCDGYLVLAQVCLELLVFPVVPFFMLHGPMLRHRA